MVGTIVIAIATFMRPCVPCSNARKVVTSSKQNFFLSKDVQSESEPLLASPSLIEMDSGMEVTHYDISSFASDSPGKYSAKFWITDMCLVLYTWIFCGGDLD